MTREDFNSVLLFLVLLLVLYGTIRTHSLTQLPPPALAQRAPAQSSISRFQQYGDTGLLYDTTTGRLCAPGGHGGGVVYVVKRPVTPQYVDERVLNHQLDACPDLK